MGRLLGRVLFSVGAFLIVSADDGWRRISEPVIKNDARARSSDSSGSRIPFSPEDRVPPPPWLMPPNPTHLGFPPARPKVMSFFDEEPSEFMPWPPKSAPPNHQPITQPQSRSHQPDLSSFLQPPPAKKEVLVAEPIHHQQQQYQNRQDQQQREDYRHHDHQRQVPLYKPKPQLVPPPATVPPSVANLKQIPSVLANERQHEDVFKAPELMAAKPTEAPQNSARPLEASRRKSVRPIYDSSEYDYEDVAGHEAADSRTAQDESFIEDAEEETAEAYHDNQQRRQSNKNGAPEMAPVDYEIDFDPEETIFRTQVGSQFRPQQPANRYHDTERIEARQEEPEERPAARPSNKGHHHHQASRKQQQQQQQQVHQQQQSGRDRSPTEASRFETERPHSNGNKPEQQRQQQQQQQQPADDWPAPYRGPSPVRKPSKPKTPVPTVTEAPPLVDDYIDDVNFESGKTRVKSPSFFAETEKSRRPSQQQQRNNEKIVANENHNSNKQQDNINHQSEAPLDGARPTRTRRPKPTQPPPPPQIEQPASFAPEERDYQPSEYQPPRSTRRPRPQQQKPKPAEPEPAAVEYFEDDEPLIPFSVPSPKTRRPQQQQQQRHQQQEQQHQEQLQIPKDGTLATKGLQTLKTLAALQSDRQPPQRPQQREPVEEKVLKPAEGRRPAKRPSANRYQPPINPEPITYDNEPKSNRERLPSDNEPTAFNSFFKPQEPVDDYQQTGDDRSDELPTLKPFVIKQTTTTTTTTTEPSVSDESEENKPSSLFPPFNKRARPTPTTPAPEKVAESRRPIDKEPAPVVPRITSYKQRIEAMKERVRQQQQNAQPKKDDDEESERVESAAAAATTTTTTTTTTTRRPTTTRAKFPTRMPTKRPITVASTTTESATVETKELPSFDESRRRFRPKSSYSNRRPEVVKDEAEARSDEVQEEVPKKLRDNPYSRRNQQQQQKEKSQHHQQDEQKPIETKLTKDPSKRRPNFSRTTTSRPVIVQEEEEEPEEVLPVSSKPQSAEAEEEPKIELVEVASVEQTEKKPHDERVEEAKIEEHFEATQEPFVEKPALIDEDIAEPEPQITRERMPIFTMVTNDPMLPIEELLNIRIRDDGKGM